MEMTTKPYGTFCQFRRPDDGYPWFINIIVTTKCNLRCEMCKSYEVKPEHAPAEKVLEFFNKLGDWLPKPRMVILTGGEPLVHPNILDYIRKLTSVGLIPALNSNGVALTREMIEKLQDAGLRMINISLDGFSNVHNFQRNGPGLYDGVRDVLYHLSKKTDFEISVVSVISAYSAKDLPRLVQELSKNSRLGGIQFQALIPTLSRPWDLAFYDESPMWPTTPEKLNQVLKTLDTLILMREQGYPINNPPSQFEHWRRYFNNPKNFLVGQQCTVAENNLQMHCDGSLIFCNNYGKLGTIGDDPKILWESAIAAKMRQNMKKCTLPCNYFVNCCYIEQDVESDQISKDKIIST